METIVNLIGNTKTASGLTVQCEVDTNLYTIGIKISDEQMAQLGVHQNNFRGEWNYTILPLKMDE